MGKLRYKHFLIDIDDALIPSLIGGEFVGFDYIKANLRLEALWPDLSVKPELPPKSGVAPS